MSVRMFVGLLGHVAYAAAPRSARSCSTLMDRSASGRVKSSYWNASSKPMWLVAARSLAKYTASSRDQ